MPLNNFGSVLTFAIAQEGRLQRFYNTMTAVEGIDQPFIDAVQRYRERVDLLVQLQQEDLAHELSVPIVGLLSENYEPELRSDPIDRKMALYQSVRMEQRASRFYSDVAIKLHNPDVAELFRALAQENLDHVVALQALEES